MNLVLSSLIFLLFFVTMFFAYKRGIKMPRAKLEINSQNKDFRISIEDYLKKINFQLLLLHYLKNEKELDVLEYKPFSLHSVFNGKEITINKHSLFLEIEGPKHMVILLAKLIETEKSNLAVSIV